MDLDPALHWKVGWGPAGWLNPPPEARRDQDDLLIEAAEGSDLWRTTSYGFIHDTGHALLADFPDQTAAEVTFVADFSAQFDQAGLLVRADAERWIKAGVESATACRTSGPSSPTGSRTGQWLPSRSGPER